MHPQEQGPGETRRDIPPTRRDSAPEVTRRDDAPTGAGTSFARLPTSLAGRFTVVGELSAHGAEADLTHVRGHAEQDYVVKIYRSGVRASTDVWHKLSTLDTSHIVRMYETGHSDGRDFELLEYAEDGTLADLVAATPVLSAEQVIDVVRQLTSALECLHNAGVVHRDLKPANILIRRHSPLELAVTDFGLSKSLDASMMYASTSRTVAYAAPESLAGRVSPAFDWWSLGMIVRQLSTGHPPFAGLSELAALDHLATRPIDVSDVADTRTRLLCRGLLVRDPDLRWGTTQVHEWLAGADPTIPDDVAPPPTDAGIKPLVFNGERCTDKRALATALAGDWSNAARRYFATMGSRQHPSEGWRALRGWLAQFDDPDVDDVEGRVELVDRHLTTAGHTPDIKLLYLLAWLDPDLPPLYRGVRLRLDDLVSAAARAEQGDAESRRMVDDLWTHALLPLLSGFAGGTGLVDVDQRWRTMTAEWNALLVDVQLLPRRVAAELRDDSAHYALLELAATPVATTRRWQDAAHAALDAMPGPVDWLAALSSSDDDPLRLLAIRRAAPFAAAEWQRAARQWQAEQARQTARQDEWQRREDQRLAGRSDALGQALLGTSLAYAVPIGLLVLIALSTGGPGYAGVAFGLWVSQCLAEALVARWIGSDYHPEWSLRGRLPHWWQRRPRIDIVSAMPGGCGCLGMVILIVVVLTLLLYLTVAGAAVAAIAHWVWSVVRISRWNQRHEQDRQTVLGDSV